MPDAVAAAKEYQVDGAVFWGARGCRMYPAALATIKDAVKKARPGMPTVTIDADFNDPNFVSTRELQESIERFMEIVEEDK